MKAMIALAAAATLGFAAQPAAAQDALPDIDPSRITGAAIEQGTRIDPRDLIRGEDGGYTAKPHARVLRERRRCPLSLADARVMADALGHARVSAEQWQDLGADMTIRFQGVTAEGSPLTAILQGFPDRNPNGEMRIFYGHVAAWLSRADQAVISGIAVRVGCPFSVREQD